MKVVHGGNLIADDAKLIGAEGYAVETEPGVVLSKRMLRADWQRLRAMGNLANRISFSVTRTHASASDAEIFWLSHALVVNGQADAVFTCGESEDTEDVTLADAVLVATGERRAGAKTTFRYSLEGAELS